MRKSRWAMHAVSPLSCHSAAVADSRKRSSPELKDSVPDCSELNIAKHSHDGPEWPGEFLKAAVEPIQQMQRSFDCIVVRLADDHFAQDDSEQGCFLAAEAVSESQRCRTQ